MRSWSSLLDKKSLSSLQARRISGSSVLNFKICFRSTSFFISPLFYIEIMIFDVESELDVVCKVNLVIKEHSFLWTTSCSAGAVHVGLFWISSHWFLQGVLENCVPLLAHWGRWWPWAVVWCLLGTAHGPSCKRMPKETQDWEQLHHPSQPVSPVCAEEPCSLPPLSQRFFLVPSGSVSCPRAFPTSAWQGCSVGLLHVLRPPGKPAGDPERSIHIASPRGLAFI